MSLRIVILHRPGKSGLCCWSPIAAWDRGGEGVVAIAVESRLATTKLADFLVIVTPDLPDFVSNLTVLVQLGIALLF